MDRQDDPHDGVSGKNRDDLQAVIALVKWMDLGVALQVTNFRST